MITLEVISEDAADCSWRIETTPAKGTSCSAGCSHLRASALQYLKELLIVICFVVSVQNNTRDTAFKRHSRRPSQLENLLGNSGRADGVSQEAQGSDLGRAVPCQQNA